ncbi:MAG: hypothetical protein ACRCXZ_08260, partial [Patescibacteria group bacterium]
MSESNKKNMLAYTPKSELEKKVHKLNDLNSKIQQALDSLKQQGQALGLDENVLSNPNFKMEVQFKGGLLEKIGRNLTNNFRDTHRGLYIINTYQGLLEQQQSIQEFMDTPNDTNIHHSTSSFLNKLARMNFASGPEGMQSREASIIIKETEKLLKESRSKRVKITEDVVPYTISAQSALAVIKNRRTEERYDTSTMRTNVSDIRNRSLGKTQSISSPETFSPEFSQTQNEDPESESLKTKPINPTVDDSPEIVEKLADITEPLNTNTQVETPINNPAVPDVEDLFEQEAGNTQIPIQSMLEDQISEEQAEKDRQQSIKIDRINQVTNLNELESIIVSKMDTELQQVYSQKLDSLKQELIQKSKSLFKTLVVPKTQRKKELTEEFKTLCKNGGSEGRKINDYLNTILRLSFDSSNETFVNFPSEYENNSTINIVKYSGTQKSFVFNDSNETNVFAFSKEKKPVRFDEKLPQALEFYPDATILMLDKINAFFNQNLETKRKRKNPQNTLDSNQTDNDQEKV